jgi:hypothetical protein
MRRNCFGVFVIIHTRQVNQRRLLTSRKREGYPSAGRPASISRPLASDHRDDLFVVAKMSEVLAAYLE